MHRSPNHDTHDATLIAGHAAGDLVATQLILAERLLASCEACSILHADLRAITAATRSLPAPSSIPADSDFRITASDAARLRRGGIVRRLLRPFAGRASGVRPLAAAFSTLGAAGLALVLLLPLVGGPAALPALERVQLSALDGGATSGPEGGIPGNASGPKATDGAYNTDDLSTAAPGDVEVPGPDPANDREDAVAPESPVNAATYLLMGSAGLLGVGLLLLALRAAARRVA